jgi:hypothetical protein
VARMLIVVGAAGLKKIPIKYLMYYFLFVKPFKVKMV